MVKGVIDCSDLPLSISRETYQDSSLIYKLKNVLTKRVLKKLEEESKNDPESYDKWFDEFNQQLKEGIISDTDNVENIMRLQRFRSNFTDKKIGIEEYVSKLIKDQEKIYFIINTDNDHPTSSIYLETYKKTDLPVLISNNPFDEVIFRQVQQYKSIQHFLFNPYFRSQIPKHRK